MSVLDELREWFELTVRDEPHRTITTRLIRDYFRRFEAAHPGLVDMTDHCHYCGAPMAACLPPRGRTCPTCAEERKE